MALKKAFKYKGFDCNYHKITSLEWNLITGQAKVEVSAYKDEDYRTEAVEYPATSRLFFPAASDFIGCPDILVKAYELLKALPEWADAEDC